LAITDAEMSHNLGLHAPSAHSSVAAGPNVDLVSLFKPPLRDPKFWITQAGVLAIAGVHVVVEGFGLLSSAESFYFIPISLFFIPVLYAALHFGTTGAIATGLWCFVLASPVVVLAHSGLERWSEAVHIALVIGIGLIVGLRVTSERRQRERTEEAWQLAATSQRKYQDLFDSSGEPVLIVDEEGYVLDSNRAGSDLLACLPAESLPSAFGRLPAELMLSLDLASPQWRPGPSPAAALRMRDGEEVWLQPVSTVVEESNRVVQVVLRDLTDQKRREEGLEAFSAHIVRAQEEERRRIAQELHDETVHSLLLLCRKLDDSTAAAGDGESLKSAMREAHAFTATVVESVRGAVRRLRPPLLDDLGLIAAIEKLTDETTALLGIESRIEVRGEPARLPDDVELVLFRIVQEALHNVERHSGAASVSICLAYTPTTVSVEVADQGRGFSVPAKLEDFLRDDKMGVLGMQERARTFGGHLAITSEPGRGTRVRAELPVRQATSRSAPRA
jgi:signal transduction histidine kinase